MARSINTHSTHHNPAESGVPASHKGGWAAVALVACSFGLTAPVQAAPYFFDPGVACDFPLGYEVTQASDHRVHVETKGRIIDAGKGYALRLINGWTGATLDLKGNGAVSIQTVTPQPDGSSLTKLLGHWILIMYPTDVPAGPSTTLYTGQVTFTTDANFVTTIKKTAGSKTDLCAALSP